MDRGEAEELGRFRRLIDGEDLVKLVPIIAAALDECVDVLRKLAPSGNVGVETAAALAAELHKRERRLTTATYAPVVGNA